MRMVNSLCPLCDRRLLRVNANQHQHQQRSCNESRLQGSWLALWLPQATASNEPRASMRRLRVHITAEEVAHQGIQ